MRRYRHTIKLQFHYNVSSKNEWVFTISINNLIDIKHEIDAGVSIIRVKVSKRKEGWKFMTIENPQCMIFEFQGTSQIK